MKYADVKCVHERYSIMDTNVWCYCLLQNCQERLTFSHNKWMKTTKTDTKHKMQYLAETNGFCGKCKASEKVELFSTLKCHCRLCIAGLQQMTIQRKICICNMYRKLSKFILKFCFLNVVLYDVSSHLVSPNTSRFIIYLRFSIIKTAWN